MTHLWLDDLQIAHLYAARREVRDLEFHRDGRSALRWFSLCINKEVASYRRVSEMLKRQIGRGTHHSVHSVKRNAHASRTPLPQPTA